MKVIALGTAMWGWSIDKKTGFELLDEFYKTGGRYIDTARNYPLNGQKEKDRFSENVIYEWIRAHAIDDLSIIYKAGSTSNVNTPNNDLSPSFIAQEYDRVQENAKNNRIILMIHWDNRNDHEQIANTLEKLTALCGDNIGFSGIKHPKAYADVLRNNNHKNSYYIEIKSNIHTSSIPHYNPIIQPNSKIFAYGISISGIKLNADEYTPNSYVNLARATDYHQSIMTEELKEKIISIKEIDSSIKSMYHIGLLFSESTPHLYGYIVAPSSTKQLSDIFAFRKNIPEIIKKGELNTLHE